MLFQTQQPLSYFKCNHFGTSTFLYLTNSLFILALSGDLVTKPVSQHRIPNSSIYVASLRLVEAHIQGVEVMILTKKFTTGPTTVKLVMCICILRFSTSIKKNLHSQPARDTAILGLLPISLCFVRSDAVLLCRVK